VVTILITGPHPDFRRGRLVVAGFTLLELILVLLLLSVVLASAAPSLRVFSASRRVAEAAAQIVALAQYARTQAIAEGRVYRLNLDLEGGRYWVTAQTGGAFLTLENEFGRVFALPEGTRIVWVEPPPTPALAATPGLQLPWQAATATSLPATRDHLTFFPDGRAETARLRIYDRRDNVLDIACATPADRFRVVSAGEEARP